jgi:hypothetical protein
MSQDESVVREKATELADRARDKASEVQHQAGGQLRQQIGQRSGQAGEQVRAIGHALRETSDQLRGEGQDLPARITDQAAQRLDSVGSYLLGSDPDRILADVEDFARRYPWGVAAGAALIGIAASRFLKASSQRRYDASVTDLRRYERTETSYERDPYEPRTYEPQRSIGETHSL